MGFAAISSTQHFVPGEFPPTADDISPLFFETLDAWRDQLGQVVHPSRDPDGWVRYEGSDESRHHYTRADAGDVFPEGDVLRAFLLATRFFGGVGIYYDTKKLILQPGPMLHLDLREKPLVWCRAGGQYYYPANGGNEAAQFWRHAAQYAAAMYL